MKKYLVLIMTCRKNKSIQESISNTILKNIPENIQVLFVEGGYDETKVIGNKLQLTAKDDYKNFIYKVQDAFKYSLKMNDWDYLVKADDDAYLMLENISKYEPPIEYDYLGSLNQQAVNGAFYILSRKATQFLSKVEISGGNILGEAWGGLKIHCPENEWKNVIPEDSYFSFKMINNKMKGYDISNNLEFVKYIGKNIKEPNFIGLHPEVLAKKNNLLAFYDVEEYEFELYYNHFNPISKLSSDYIVLVCSCRKNRNKLEEIRKTWALKKPDNIKVIYLIGGYEETRLNGDILETKVTDDYKNFINKVHDSYKFLSKNAEFKYLIKCDDDVFLNLDVISKFDYNDNDIIGRIWDGIHMCGPLYILKKQVVDFLAEHQIDKNWINQNVWEGLKVHCQDSNIWKDVIPEDYYFSEVLNKTDFRRQHNPKAIRLIRYGSEIHRTPLLLLSNSIGFFDVETSEFSTFKKNIDITKLLTKVAFCVIAHNNLSEINNMINQINQNTTHHIFIYVDSNCKEDIRTIKKCSNVHIIKNRKPLYWGDFSFIHAQLRLIKEVMNCEYKFDYVSFHGSNDLLLENINIIQEYIDTRKGQNFIECKELPNNNLMFGGKWRYEYNWPLDLIRKDEHMFEDYARNRIREKLNTPIDNSFNFSLYQGLRWFTITLDAAKYCYEYSLNNRKYMKMFNKTYLPAESYFHTLLFNSDYNSTITNIIPSFMKKEARTGIFTTKNIPVPKEKVYFGRKFDTKIDNNIITKIMYSTTDINYMPVHFVWMDKNGTGFKFWHYAALKSFINCNINKRVIVHTNGKLNEPWWDKLKDDVEFRFIPENLIRKDLKFFSHNVDFYRYKVLYEEGGCYIDFDTLTMGDIDYITEPRKLVFSSCYKNIYEFSGGFFISPKPHHPLLKDVLNVYYNDYRPNNWNYNATIVPGQLAKMKYQEITKFLTDRDILFPIQWENDKDVMTYDKRYELIYRIRTAKRSTSVHFYNAAYNKMLEETTFENYKTNKTIYALMCRIALDNNWKLD